MRSALLSLIKLNRRHLAAVLTSFAMSVFVGSSAEPATPPAFEHKPTLPQVAKEVMAVHFGDKQLGGCSFDAFVSAMPVKQQFKRRAGVFVTLSYQGKTRACWGSMFPQYENLVKSTAYSTIGALTKEYRYPLIQRSEWKRLKAQVTVIKGVEPINSIACQNPLRDGLLVRAGGKSGVLLPGEASDAHFQMVQCKLKAGIKPGEPCQLYRLRTEIYE